MLSPFDNETSEIVSVKLVDMIQQENKSHIPHEPTTLKIVVTKFERCHIVIIVLPFFFMYRMLYWFKRRCNKFKNQNRIRMYSLLLDNYVSECWVFDVESFETTRLAMCRCD